MTINRNISTGFLARIKELILEITGDNREAVICFNDVLFNESSRSKMGSSSVSVSCIFLDEEDRICADMYRAGIAGFYEFICGISIDDLPVRGLEEIVFALENRRWSINDETKPKKKSGSRNFLMNFRIPFHLKGA